MNVQAAYRECEGITRREAKNFAYGIRLLRPPERHALSAVYALARRIDDIGDGEAPAEERAAQLGEVRTSLRSVATGRTDDDPVWVALHDAASRYPLPLSAFDDLIDGCEMDVRGTSYETFDELVVYCRKVAGSIGRLSLGIFGSKDPARAVSLADDLGVALQLTNIARDVLEDRARGRVYLPLCDAREMGCLLDLSGPAGAVDKLIALQCERAEAWFDRGIELLPLLDRRSRACVGAMSGIYHHLLRRIAQDPRLVNEGRLSLSTWEKVWVTTSSLAGTG